MKKIQKLLPFKLVILSLIIILGSVGFAVKAAEKPTLEDTVNQFLGNLQKIGQTPSIITENAEQTLGGMYHPIEEYFTKGICFDSGGQRCISQQASVLKYTNNGGTTYAELNTSQSSTGGWNTDPTNTHIYPTTNSLGNSAPVVVGATASTSIAGASDVLMVVGAMSVTGAIAADGGAFTFNNASGNDLDFRMESATDENNFISDASGNAIGIGVADPDAKLEVLKAGTQLKLSYDGTYYATFAVGSGGDLTLVPSGGDMTLTSTLAVGTTTIGASDFTIDTTTLYVDADNNTVGIGVADPDYALEVLSTTAPLKLSYDGSNACTYVVSSGGDLTQNCSGNDVSFASDNLVTTGNISGANGTFTGSMTWDTDTLIVANTTDRVGVGSTTPLATLSVDSNAGDRAFLVGSSSRNQFLIDASMDLFVNDDDLVVDWSSGYTGLGTTTPFTALGITNTGTQLSLAYDGTNYTTITTGSGGDLTIAASGGDISFSNENLTTTGTLAIATTTIASGDLIVDTDTLIVDNDNNRVGIGTTTPGYLLDVDGNFNVGIAGSANVFFVNSTTANVGIGTSSPMSAFSVTDTGTQITIAYDTTNYSQYAVGSGGDLTITASGGDISFSNENLVTTGSLTAATSTVGSFTQGGAILASSTTATAGTLTEAELLVNSKIDFIANTGNTTLTLPATSTMTTLLPTAGQSRTWWIENATTTAATTLTIAAGTGIDLIGVTNADDVIDGTETAQLTCIRETNTDVTCIVSELLNVD